MASRACYIGVIGLSEGGPATRDQTGTNKSQLRDPYLSPVSDLQACMHLLAGNKSIYICSLVGGCTGAYMGVLMRTRLLCQLSNARAIAISFKDNVSLFTLLRPKREKPLSLNRITWPNPICRTLWATNFRWLNMFLLNPWRSRAPSLHQIRLLRDRIKML